MTPPLTALIVAASVLWAVWVGELIDRSFLTLLPVIWFMLGFGWIVGWWLGDERMAGWTLLGFVALAGLVTVVALVSGRPGAGLPLLVGAVPAVLATPLAQAGGRFAEQRRGRGRGRRR